MTHIGDALTPFQGALGEAPPQPEQARIEVDETAVKKALLVLRTLKAAGIKMPYEFDLEDAAPIWASQLGRFTAATLNDAVASWIADATDWPTVSEIEAIAQYTLTENMRRSSEADARNRGPCEECDGVLYVRVIDATIEQETYASKKARRRHPTLEPEYEKITQHHMAPCTRCLPERSDLYTRGHFDAEHADQGGCAECRHYHQPWRYKDPRTMKGRVA